MNKGFAAIVSVLAISAILLIVVFSLSTNGYFTRNSVTYGENRELAYSLARSCLDIAQFNFTIEFDYPGNETIQVGPYTCFIKTVIRENEKDYQPKKKGKGRRIETTATVGASQSTLRMHLNRYLIPTSFEIL